MEQESTSGQDHKQNSHLHVICRTRIWVLLGVNLFCEKDKIMNIILTPKYDKIFMKTDKIIAVLQNKERRMHYDGKS